MDAAALLGAEHDEHMRHRRVSQEQRDIVNTCIDAVEKRANSLKAKGLNKRNFVFGVSNTIFVAWSFGAIPQHLWIIYIMEVSVLFPLRWVNQVKATPKQHFYWCDFCWVANFTAVLVVLAFVVDACTTDALLSDSLRKALFSSAWGIACGPLLLATGVLGNALLFHDADNVASVLIHLFPSLLLFVVRWHHDEVHKAWPRVFHLNFFEEINPWSDIYLKAAAGYSVWLVTYCVWLLAFGMALPNKGYDTIFHANMRGGLGASVAKLLGVSPDEHDIRAKSNDFTRSYFVAYIIGHALLGPLRLNLCREFG